MFGIGWTEMMVIGIVALIVIGPKDLPVVMNRLGKAISAVRRMGNDFQRELNKASGLEQITDLRKSITEPLKQTAADIRREFNAPLSGGGVTPSGAIKPKDPKAESVVDEIHANLGMKAPQAIETPDWMEPKPRPVVVKPIVPNETPAAAIESPAPPEASVPVKKPRAPRKKAVDLPVPDASAGPDMFAEPAAVAVKKRAPRKPKSDA